MSELKLIPISEKEKKDVINKYIPKVYYVLKYSSIVGDIYCCKTSEGNIYVFEDVELGEDVRSIEKISDDLYLCTNSSGRKNFFNKKVKAVSKWFNKYEKVDENLYLLLGFHDVLLNTKTMEVSSSLPSRGYTKISERWYMFPFDEGEVEFLDVENLSQESWWGISLTGSYEVFAEGVLLLTDPETEEGLRENHGNLRFLLLEMKQETQYFSSFKEVGKGLLLLENLEGKKRFFDFLKFKITPWFLSSEKLNEDVYILDLGYDTYFFNTKTMEPVKWYENQIKEYRKEGEEIVCVSETGAESIFDLENFSLSSWKFLLKK